LSNEKYISANVSREFAFSKHKAEILEILWTLLPSIIVLVIAAPSFMLLYSTGMYINPEYGFKVIGHQWYWKYEFDNNLNFFTKPFMNEFDSYLFDSSSSESVPRALTPSVFLPIPIETDIRCLVTSNDVLHSWSIPTLGVKIDACPGRINEYIIFSEKTGLVVGACSEICGINHALMPTGLLMLPRFTFITK
jgi:cytochrome c oxidase subunit 2